MDFALGECLVLLQAFLGLLIVVHKHFLADLLNLVLIILLLLIQLNHTGLLVKVSTMPFVHPPHVRDFILSYRIGELSLCIDFVHALHNVELQAHGCISLPFKVNFVNF
jgi:hypothetical protein